LWCCSTRYHILLYKHQWNTKWAFPRKLHIFTREVDHRHYGYIINRAFESKLIWYFTGVYIINRILHTRLWIWILSSRVQLEIVYHSKIKFIFTRWHVISSIYDTSMQYAYSFFFCQCKFLLLPLKTKDLCFLARRFSWIWSYSWCLKEK